MLGRTARWAISHRPNLPLAALQDRNGAERYATRRAPRPAPLLHRAPWLKCHRDSPHCWMTNGGQTTTGVVSESVCKIHISNDIIWANAGALSGRKGRREFWDIVDSSIAAGGSFDEIVSRAETVIFGHLKII